MNGFKNVYEILLKENMMNGLTYGLSEVPVIDIRIPANSHEIHYEFKDGYRYDYVITNDLSDEDHWIRLLTNMQIGGIIILDISYLERIGIQSLNETFKKIKYPASIYEFGEYAYMVYHITQREVNEINEYKSRESS